MWSLSSLYSFFESVATLICHVVSFIIVFILWVSGNINLPCGLFHHCIHSFIHLFIKTNISTVAKFEKHKLWKESLKSDDLQVNQYQQNKQWSTSQPISTKQTMIYKSTNINKTNNDLQVYQYQQNKQWSTSLPISTKQTMIYKSTNINKTNNHLSSKNKRML
jgi:hypothetical protein